ncbi:hypothetical protein AVEN_172399-1 [Araneus ventricosus]|uniref:alkaline phosphatase n=1 Tax=Araneus ventricosus TaxID=182803 RepID=A0A4Y2TY49_ARAVE|nr:hypothetical protein AVEN_172399-1 [Araneus ventricosus]
MLRQTYGESTAYGGIGEGRIRTIMLRVIGRTYNTDSQVGDSGACATALLCGVKGRFETVGLDDKGVYNRCESSFESKVFCLADWAQTDGQ